MKKLLIPLISSAFFIAHNDYAVQPTFSNDPLEEKLFHLKYELKDKEHAHIQLLNKSLNCNCPKDGSFTIAQKLMSSGWVKKCQEIDTEIAQSKDELAYLEDQITDLKLRQKAKLIKKQRQKQTK